MTLPPDPDETPLTPQNSLDGCARSAFWLAGAGVFIFLLARIAGHSERRGGVIAVGFAAMFFAFAAGRPPFVTGLRFHPSFRRFGEWRKGDFLGEAYMIVLGLIFLVIGLYRLLATPTP